VVLEVLDARDPAGSRSLDIEQKVRVLGKRLVLVLNKIDLVPKDVLEKWVIYLRRFAPVIAIKSSTQEKQSNIGRSGIGRGHKANEDQLETTNTAVGLDAIMQLLKNYTRNFNIKTSITVACVGYPNVGKSSLINSLKRSRAVSVSAVAGHTKVMQEVNLDAKIKLIDSPGVVFDPSDTDGMVLRNCINVEDLEDPTVAVESIVNRCRPVQLMQLYNVPAFSTVSQFLGHVARQTGKLKKGGIPDLISTAKNIVHDWNHGKIPYFTSPPKDEVVEAAEGFETQLLTDWGPQFDITQVQDLTTIKADEQGKADVSMDTDEVKPITMELAPRFPVPSKRDIFAENSDDDSDGDDDDDDDDDDDESMGTTTQPNTDSAKNVLNKRKRKELDSLSSLMEGSMAVQKANDGDDSQTSSIAKKDATKKKKKKSRRRAAERTNTAHGAGASKEHDNDDAQGSSNKKKKVTPQSSGNDNFNFDAVFQ
jgi:nuclear GTP-binding protein